MTWLVLTAEHPSSGSSISRRTEHPAVAWRDLRDGVVLGLIIHVLPARFVIEAVLGIHSYSEPALQNFHQIFPRSQLSPPNVVSSRYLCTPNFRLGLNNVTRVTGIL